MKIKKARVTKEDGNWYPEYKWYFWWRRFIKNKCQNVGFQIHCGDYVIKYATEEEAVTYAEDSITIHRTVV